VTAPIQIDHVIVVCGGCRKERKLYPDKSIVGADALMEWANANVTRCRCGAPTYNLKAHIANPQELI
jgi:hypothetical protein